MTTNTTEALILAGDINKITQRGTAAIAYLLDVEGAELVEIFEEQCPNLDHLPRHRRWKTRYKVGEDT